MYLTSNEEFFKCKQTINVIMFIRTGSKLVNMSESPQFEWNIWQLDTRKCQLCQDDLPNG